MQIEFKVTSWKAITTGKDIPEEYVEKLKERIRNDEVTSSMLFDELDDMGLEPSWEDFNYDVEEDMSLEENDYYSTIELRDDNANIIARNCLADADELSSLSEYY